MTVTNGLGVLVTVSIIIIIIDGSYLPFIDLNATNMVTLPSALDTTSVSINISGNFSFGSRSMTNLYVRV